MKFPVATQEIRFSILEILCKSAGTYEELNTHVQQCYPNTSFLKLPWSSMFWQNLRYLFWQYRIISEKISTVKKKEKKWAFLTTIHQSQWIMKFLVWTVLPVDHWSVCQCIRPVLPLVQTSQQIKFMPISNQTKVPLNEGQTIIAVHS